MSAPSASLCMMRSCSDYLIDNLRGKRPHQWGSLIGLRSRPSRKVHQAKSKVLHLSQGSFQFQHRLNDDWIENSTEKKDLRVLVDEKLDTSQQWALTAQKANCILGFITRWLTSRAKEKIVSLCSVLLRSHLQYCIQLWDPQNKRYMELLEQIQGRLCG